MYPFYILPITFYINKKNTMKLSAIVLTAMISYSAVAQTPKQKGDDKTKTKTSTAIKVKKNEPAKKDSVKVPKNKNIVISHDYCPPCGMG